MSLSYRACSLEEGGCGVRRMSGDTCIDRVPAEVVMDGCGAAAVMQ